VSDYTAGPWTIIQLPSMAYRIDAKVGPLHVCPAIAHGLADARLIAAAPQLLIELRDMRARYRKALIDLGWSEERAALCLVDADTAIAAAGGI
jgi:hypothetical protein